jgi:hypothetical protein
MDQEAAQRRFCELELLRRRPRSFRHQTTPCYPTHRVDQAIGRSPLGTENHMSCDSLAKD